MIETNTATAQERVRRAPERDALLSSIHRIVPLLNERSRQAEIERTLPTECVDALTTTGAYAMLAPREVGGLEVDPITMVEVIEVAAAANPSAGWDIMVGASNAALVGAYVSDRAAAEVFSGGQIPFIAGTVKAGTATFQPVSGGYRVSAKWGFGSGVYHAEWVMVMANGPDGVGVGMIVPRSAVTIHDTWHVAGLQGTGSAVYEVTDLFVPSHMSWELPYVHRRGGPSTQVPQFLVAGLSAVALGLARRALDEVVEQAKAKVRPGSSTAIAGRQYFQHVLGELEVELRAARTLRLAVLAEIWAAFAHEEPISAEQWDYDNAVNAYVSRVCSRVTSKAFEFGGSASASLSNSLQRTFRDMAVAAQHLQLSEQYFEVFGRARLGIAGTGDGPPSYSHFGSAKSS